MHGGKLKTLKYSKLSGQAKPPARKHPADAGVDVYALESVEIPPHSCAKVRTGLTFEIGPDFMLLAKPKSGSDFLVGAGVLDPEYQGEVLVKIVNYSAEPLVINPGDPIAQLVQVRIYTDPLEELPGGKIHQQETQRGADGGIVRQAS
jgi:dUTP pyrophosphatase